MGFVYDNNITLPNNKTGADPVPPQTGIGPTDINLLCNSLLDVRTVLQAAGVRDVAILNVNDYGADSGGSADSTAAFLAAIAAGPTAGAIIYAPAGTYKISASLRLVGKTGFVFCGDGKQATVLQWAGAAGVDFIYVADSQLWTIRDLTLSGLASAPPRCAIRSHVSLSPAYSPYGMTFANLHIDGASAGAFTHGIWFDTEGPGGNSEALYLNCNVFRCVEDCVRTEGAQAKTHNFYHTNLGVSKRGIHSFDPGGGIGATPPELFSGGSFGSHSVAAIVLTYPGETLHLDAVDSEHCYRFIDMGSTPTSSTQAISVTNSRLDCGSGTSPTPAFSTWMRLNGVGPYEITGTSISGGADGVPQIALYSGGPVALKYEGNQHISNNSVATSPINNTTDYQGGWALGRNKYGNAAGNDFTKQRMEPLDIACNAGVDVFTQDGEGRYLLTIPTSLWTAAAVTQTVTVCTLPRGAQIKMCGFYAYIQYALPAAPTLTFKLGTTSGGDELLLAADVSTSSPIFYGGAAGDLGAILAAPVQGGVVNYTGTQALYLTAHSTSGNLGTGSVTRMTAGQGYLVLEVIPQARFLVSQ